MTWRELASELSDLTDEAANVVAILKERNLMDVQDLLRAEPAERRAVDKACVYYAQHGNWPSMSQLQAALAYIRLAHATLFAELLARSPVFLNHMLDSPRATILEFLLIDVWSDFGRKRWISS